jgi:hypothetical protein
MFQIDMTKDALFRGEFEVVKELLAAFPGFNPIKLFLFLAEIPDK